VPNILTLLVSESSLPHPTSQLANRPRDVTLRQGPGRTGSRSSRDRRYTSRRLLLHSSNPARALHGQIASVPTRFDQRHHVCRKDARTCPTRRREVASAREGRRLGRRSCPLAGREARAGSMLNGVFSVSRLSLHLTKRGRWGRLLEAIAHSLWWKTLCGGERASQNKA
jgi:hypothetical protein